jgi:hypothetical protein
MNRIILSKNSYFLKNSSIWKNAAYKQHRNLLNRDRLCCVIKVIFIVHLPIYFFHNKTTYTKLLPTIWSYYNYYPNLLNDIYISRLSVKNKAENVIYISRQNAESIDFVYLTGLKHTKLRKPKTATSITVSTTRYISVNNDGCPPYNMYISRQTVEKFDIAHLTRYIFNVLNYQKNAIHRLIPRHGAHFLLLPKPPTHPTTEYLPVELSNDESGNGTFRSPNTQPNTRQIVEKHSVTKQTTAEESARTFLRNVP